MKLAGTDFTILRVFDAVVRHGGFSSAQPELSISPSTISNHISSLEKRLGIKLCERGRSGFRLTDKGSKIHVAAQKLLQSLDDFSIEAEALKGKLVGNFRIGVVDCISTDENSKLVEAFALFNKNQNDVTLNIFQESPQVLQEQLLDGLLNIGVGSFPYKLSGLIYEPLYDEAHSLYCSNLHHLFSVDDADIDINSLHNEERVNRGYWRTQHRKNWGFENAKAEVMQIEPQLLLIRSGHYIGFLPDHFAKSWVESGQLRRLVPDQVSYICTFDLVVKKGYRKTQVSDAIIESIVLAHQSPLTAALL